jgi:UDP-GlcNAc:undecaprenyl-phosphate GlcNAc-1-phosphate transferase
MDPVSPWLYMPLTVLLIVAVTNSINLADGLDGLAAGMMLLTLAGTALLAFLAEGTEVLLVVMAVMGVIVGFLRFNTYPARIFMGDTGSQFLGFTVVTLLIILTQQISPVLNPALPLLLIGVPLFDTAFVIIKRIHYGKSPFVADRNHIHHQILALKFDHYEAVVMIYLVQALFVGCAIIMRYYSDLVIVSTWLLANSVLAFILIIAGRNFWHVHQKNSQSSLARMVIGSRSHTVYSITAAVISYSLVLALVAGPVLTGGIDKEFGMAAAILLVLLCARLLLGYRLWFVSLRLITYVTLAFILYLLGNHPAGIYPFDGVYEYLYFGLIVVALLVGSRFTIEDAFMTTPMDFLLILVLAGLVFIPQARIVEESIIHLIIKMFIMFYAVEFALRSIKSRLNSLTIGTLWALSVIAVKGLAFQ